ncbi:PIN domain-containing protein [Paucibacter soli]|uniref:PIN domain-containing protein n=1 Tax=Paucibacter soli TaxID=3133433 RepID=UPI003095546F
MPTPQAVPCAVIDTQVVMDWLIFAEPSVQALVLALTSGRLRWVGSAAMRAELLHVLGRGIAASRAPDLGAIEAAFDQWCHTVPEAPPPAVRLSCRDPDDQMFIDLAVAQQCEWLISRDRAVLALAKRARALRLNILTPQAWIKAQALPPQK